MARKEIDITLDESAGRDAGKTFRIVEMPASRAEEWAVKALLALADGGNIEGLDPSQGVAGLAKAGIKALSGLTWDKAAPLYAELMTCVSIVSKDDPKVTAKLTPSTIDAQVEEIGTLLKLRLEALKLHVGFLQGGGFLNSLKGNAAQGSPNTSTSAPS